MTSVSTRKQGERELMFTIIFAELTAGCQATPAKTISVAGAKTQLGQNTVAIEATEGLNQSDYLRRLARQMKEDNARWQREDGLGIRAIGLLGSDIYDKLMILRALRPQFPDAVFLPTTMTRILSAATIGTLHTIWSSPRRLAAPLPDIYIEQRHIPPFRDNNQTSMYIGTLVATGRMTERRSGVSFVAAAHLRDQPPRSL